MKVKFVEFQLDGNAAQNLWAIASIEPCMRARFIIRAFTAVSLVTVHYSDKTRPELNGLVGGLSTIAAGAHFPPNPPNGGAGETPFTGFASQAGYDTSAGMYFFRPTAAGGSDTITVQIEYWDPAAP